jgi:serine/threonine protein kinase
MPQQVPLRPGDPSRVGRYRLGGRIEGIPSEDPIFIGLAPDGSEVAISLLGGDWALDAATRDRFAAEAAVARRVPPFCAARVLDAGVDAAGAYLVSEYVPGPSLLEVILTDGVRQGHELEAVAIGMATGLASVHQAGLVHGNFGPEYLVIPPDGPPRVVEFGITPPYGAATPSADMLAWAQTVVFAACGHGAASAADLDVLPDQLRGPVEECLDSEPGQRPAARAVVLSLLGDVELPAGLLAEGSRRAARSAALRGGQDQFIRAQYPGRGAGGRAGELTRPPHSPGDRHRTSGPNRHPAGHGGRTGWLIAGVVVVILALIIVVVLHVAHGGQSASGRLSANASHETTRSPSPTPSPSHGPVTPAAFTGSWTGQVRQPPTDTYNVSVSFAAGAASGTISYSGTDFSCSGALNLTAATPTRLTLSQGIIQGQSNCENGQVTITLMSAGSIYFSFHSDGPIAAGTLSRT